MKTWQVDISVLRQVNERLLECCVDEGERKTDWEGLHPLLKRVAEDKPAIIEAVPESALWLCANPPDCIPEPYRSALVALAAHQSPSVRRAVVEAMVPVVSVPG